MTRRWLHRASMAGLAAFVAAMIACNANTRFEVLQFFFDGVDPPEGYVLPDKPADADQATTSPLRQTMAAGRAPLTPRPTPLPIISTHPAVEEGKNCRTCHDPSRGLAAVDKETRICDRCHEAERKQNNWNHGPINLGNCLPCHRAHGSPYPHLLDQPIPELCLHCHTESEPGAQTEHDFKNLTPELRDCLKCHDPHRTE